MSATTTQGTGAGDSRKWTTNELSILANGPSIIFSGLAEYADIPTSPPSTSNSVTFPYALPGGADKYIVMLTSINGGATYVVDRDEDSDGNFTGFTFGVESDSVVMYMVAKVGARPNIWN